MNKPDQATSNKQVLQTFLELFMSGRWDEFDRVIHPDCVMHYSGDLDEVGLELIVEGWRDYYGKLSNLSAVTHAEVSEGEFLMVLFTIGGTYEGTFEGQMIGATPVKYRQAETMRIVDGRIAEWWVVYDELVLAQQLGFELKPK
jgi:predicted ester cyclase